MVRELSPVVVVRLLVARLAELEEHRLHGGGDELLMMCVVVTISAAVRSLVAQLRRWPSPSSSFVVKHHADVGFRGSLVKARHHVVFNHPLALPINAMLASIAGDTDRSLVIAMKAELKVRRDPEAEAAEDDCRKVIRKVAAEEEEEEEGKRFSHKGGLLEKRRALESVVLTRDA